MSNAEFRFKQFVVQQDRCAMEVSTDGVLLGAWADLERACRILDIGTGTGLLALMAAQRNPSATIDAIEVDTEAVDQAIRNVFSSPWSGRIRVHHMDVRRIVVTEPFDHVICNPPYYGGEMRSSDVRTSIAKHSASLSFEELMAVVDRVLSAIGRASFIIPFGREKELVGHAVALGLMPERVAHVVYTEGRSPKRLMIDFTRTASGRSEETLTVERSPGVYSETYRRLLAPFMLHF